MKPCKHQISNVGLCMNMLAEQQFLHVTDTQVMKFSFLCHCKSHGLLEGLTKNKFHVKKIASKNYMTMKIS